MTSDPVGYEIADLSITVGEDMAFTHSFNRASATLPTGQQIGTWARWTACWRKIGGQWLLVHDQVSVPVDLRCSTSSHSHVHGLSFSLTP